LTAINDLNSVLRRAAERMEGRMNQRSPVKWTEEELAKLRQLYPVMRNKQIARLMPPRTPMSLKQMATKLGLVKRYPLPNFTRPE
jgi:hypothetical protein